MARGRVTGWWSLLCLFALAAPARAQAAGKSIGFSNLIFRVPGASRSAIASEDFRPVIVARLRSRGFAADGADGAVFGPERSSPADLMLGGTVSELECVRGSSYELVRCRMAIEWQVLDVEHDMVVYKVMTWRSVSDVPRDPVASLGQRLVSVNVDALAARRQFRALFEPERKAAPVQGYARATVRACQSSPRVMPAASEQVLGATVLVQTSSGFGSGFLLGPDGFVVTAAHVVAESAATIKLRDGREFPATVIRIDRRLDVALLRLGVAEGTALPCLPLKEEPMAVGADVYAIGSPASRELSFSLARGIVSGVRLLEGLQYLQTDAAVSSGNSGGPLVTANGELAAIVSFKLTGSAVEGVAFGVPLSGALAAIGIKVESAFTSPELLTASAVPPGAKRTMVEDRAELAPQLVEAPPPRNDADGGSPTRHADKRYIYTLGATALGSGLALVALGLLAGDGPEGSLRELNEKFVTIGALATGLGAVTIGIGVALP